VACNPQHRTDPHAKVARNTADACALVAHCADSSDLGRIGMLKALAAELRSLLPRARQAGPDTLADHCMLELGEHGHHLEHGAARWRGRVEALLVEEQVNAVGLERVMLYALKHPGYLNG
jgi:hypothetical protein